MTNLRHGAAALAAAFALFIAGPAQANDRYATPPPIVLSPDLSQPWVMQLQNPRAQGVRASVPRVVTRRQAGERRVYQPRRQQQQAALAQPPQPQVRGIDPIYLPQTVAYHGSEPAGTIIIETTDRFLYLVNGDGTAKRYGVGVGKQGFEWRGSERITRKAEWPSWRPPAEMIAREARKGRHLPTFMEGGPQNPLGARALYLGSTLYRIHGTNQPWTIGQAVSSGCIRMRNEDVKDLYARVSVGANVIVR
ncbi:L,D-transpeptidase [Oceaniradius stylonematis]|uniref:L,D-transpeptidase n=1 Tax=Oceaniradius stylonematis TaxID=2184161 RepID=A0A3A8AAT8_9HYPH|nr:L,D-transpeptidase [Oceaniradius stylonematis]RKF07036.1 L,D-transpeptidase [Oceaniradius stylonematis]